MAEVDLLRALVKEKLFHDKIAIFGVFFLVQTFVLVTRFNAGAEDNVRRSVSNFVNATIPKLSGNNPFEIAFIF